MSYPGIQISRLGGQLFLCPKNFSALTRDIGNIGNCIFFLRSKKNQTNGAAGEKKIRARCKNLAFSAQSHTSNPFLRSKKGKMQGISLVLRIRFKNLILKFFGGKKKKKKFC